MRSAGSIPAEVITCSDRAADGTYDDRSGRILEAALQEWGFVVRREVVPDGDPVGAALRAALDRGARVVLTTGGTGIAPRDRTPEQTEPLLRLALPGVAEALRAAGVAKGVPTAVLSRGLAGIAGDAFVANLPGSTGGVRDALAVLEPLVQHVIGQLDGADHSTAHAPGTQS